MQVAGRGMVDESKEFGISMPESLHDRAVEGLTVGETSRSERIRQLVALGLATEEAAEAAGWNVPDERRDMEAMLRQVFRDADAYQAEQG